MQNQKNETEKVYIAEKIELFIIKLFFSCLAACIASPWIIQAAYNERGYKAYGGEYILIFAVHIASYYVISLFLYFRRKKLWKRKR